MITTNQMKQLNSWQKLSSNIVELYNRLVEEELLFGKDTEQYKKIVSYLELCLEEEKEFDDKIDINSTFFQEGIEFMKEKESFSADRIKARKLRNVTHAIARCNQLLEDFYKLFRESLYDNELANNIRSTIYGIRNTSIDLILSVIFLSKQELNILELIDKELEKEMDIDRKRYLLFFKYDILQNNGALESINFDFGYNYDINYVINDDVCSILFKISSSDFYDKISLLARNSLNEKICDFLKTDDESLYSSYDDFKIYVMSLINMLDNADVEFCFLYFVDEFSDFYTTNQKKYKFVENIFIKTINERKKNGKVKAKVAK